MRYPHRNIMTRALPLVGLSILLFAACKKDGAVPAYVRVVSPKVVETGGTEVSSKITDLWIYANDQPVGVWQPGRPVPVIGTGPTAIKVVAGVRKNGLTDERIAYPFYATWQQQVDLVPGQTHTLEPEIRYFDDLDFWLADFNAGVRLDTVGCTATMVLMPTDGTLVGQGVQYGRIQLDAEHDVYRGVSSGDPFTGTGSRAFLEIDYRSDTPLLIGVRYTLQGVQKEAPQVYAVPTKRADGNMPWNKLYVEMAGPWNVSGALDKRFYIKAKLENGATSGVVDVDNIKLVRP